MEVGLGTHLFRPWGRQESDYGLSQEEGAGLRLQAEVSGEQPRGLGSTPQACPLLSQGVAHFPSKHGRALTFTQAAFPAPKAALLSKPRKGAGRMLCLLCFAPSLPGAPVACGRLQKAQPCVSHE